MGPDCHMELEPAAAGWWFDPSTMTSLIPLWLVVLMVQVAQRGLVPENKRRLMCLSLFWHFLDVIWIGVFTFVYLMGMLR